MSENKLHQYVDKTSINVMFKIRNTAEVQYFPSNDVCHYIFTAFEFLIPVSLW